jgi:hypothetical protein
MTGAGTLTNAAHALIQGGRYGIQVGTGDTVNNVGTILDNAIAGAALGSGAVVNNNGTIGGMTGVVFTGTGATLNNSGTISGGGGVAVQFDAGVNSLSLGTGTVLDGDIDGGGGAGQITLSGSGTLTNAMTNFGAGSALGIASGANWIVSSRYADDTTATDRQLHAVVGRHVASVPGRQRQRVEVRHRRHGHVGGHARVRVDRLVYRSQYALHNLDGERWDQRHLRQCDVR